MRLITLAFFLLVPTLAMASGYTFIAQLEHTLHIKQHVITFALVGQQYNQGYSPFGGMGGMGGTSFQYNSGMQQQPFGGQPFGQQQYGQFGQQQQQYYGGNQYMPPQLQMYR